MSDHAEFGISTMPSLLDCELAGRAGPIAEPEAFRLRMPHMGASGVRRSWLLSEACHRHWLSIAAQVGRPASGFRDISGARVFASVVACTLDGDAAGFREDDVCELHMSEVPSAQNGWRSLFALLSGTRTLAAKILTGFARRNGRSTARWHALRRSGIALADLAGDHDRNRVFL